MKSGLAKACAWGISERILNVSGNKLERSRQTAAAEENSSSDLGKSILIV
jgi:hypothetical protein